MDVFLTGGSGYIGGAVAVRLLAAGHRVRALVRSAEKAGLVARLGIEPVLGNLDDRLVLSGEAKRADAVVNAADSDHAAAVEILIDALAGSGKPLLHTSGSSIVADEACGEPADAVFDEDTPFEPRPAKAPRVAIDRLVLAAAGRGIRSVVLCNSLIYGLGPGAHATSIQLPLLVEEARRAGIARHIGRGLNIWSNAHIGEVADLYLLALEKAEAGSFFFVENGEASFREMAAAIARSLRLPGPEPWPVEEAIARLGRQRAVYSLGSNSRVRARRARALGWAPRHASVLDWIASGELLAAIPAPPAAT